MNSVLQYILYLAVLVVLGNSVGRLHQKVMFGEKTFLSRILTPCENAVYKVLRVKKDEEMNWEKYAVSVLIFFRNRPYLSVPASTAAKRSAGETRRGFRA